MPEVMDSPSGRYRVGDLSKDIWCWQRRSRDTEPDGAWNDDYRVKHRVSDDESRLSKRRREDEGLKYKRDEYAASESSRYNSRYAEEEGRSGTPPAYRRDDYVEHGGSPPRHQRYNRRGRHVEENPRGSRGGGSPRRSRDENSKRYSQTAGNLTEEERRRKWRYFRDFFTGKELEDARREDLTVLIADLSLKATEKDIWEFFTRVGEICRYDAYQHAGKVSDIQLIKDGRSGKSKGLGYVEFHDAESVLKALNLTGQCILNQPIRVQTSQGEKNRAARAAKLQQAELAAQGPTKIYVGGLVDSLAGITTDELRQLFSPFGSIVNIEIPKDPYTGKNRGHAFIQYRQAQEARDAMAAMHCFDIGGKQVKVGFAADEQATRTPTAARESVVDENEDKLLHGGTITRLALTQKLQETKNDVYPAAVNRQNAATDDEATKFLRLTGMFTKKEIEESDMSLLEDVTEDVRTECERFGAIIEIYINRTVLDGKVYVKFEEVQSAVRSQKALHGRSYGGIAIVASFIDEACFKQAHEE